VVVGGEVVAGEEVVSGEEVAGLRRWRSLERMSPP
jgi:hypothetical protein